ncbi:MAG: Transcription elongation factor GreA [Candidatus Magasanikbacteria bacterium GW2011_GWA2_56_11]|uniref:Transcription elongation factor GreA n=1 Tax=Candidatus Magasanikbacteria bacterium GW2011_GWA2_56_11 TaxID=1619044 RepID=A0A0G1YFK5_9BACT|nr:MAG: Transcription elongation factor GreA [Candidatus Magasanikbacteria bacterium GW2011_GWA2_56_11]
MRTLNRKAEKNRPVKPDAILTESKFLELKRQLEKLKNASRPQAASEVRRLAEMGDFSENYAYQIAKGRLRGINNTILRLEHELQQATIIAPPAQTDTVQVGHAVTVECGGQMKIYRILGSAEIDLEKGIISRHSPLGSALLGHRVGETIKLKLGEREVEYRVKKIES